MYKRQAFTLTPGARVEVIRGVSEDHLTNGVTSNVDHAFLPGVGAYYAVTERLGALAGVYRGFSPAPPGDSRSGPELSVNGELGVRYDDRPARAEVIGFYNDYSNLTDICTLSSGCDEQDLDRQFSAGEARIYGLEMFGAHEIPVGLGVRGVFGGAYTLTYAEFQSTFDSQDPIYGSVTTGDEMPYVPRHQLTVTAGAEHDRFGVNAAAFYVARMREEAGSGPIEDGLATDDQFWMDVSAYYRPLEWTKLYVDARNVTDSVNVVSHRPYGARPNAPRWIQVGVKVEL